jgi:hypothetical protein
MIFLIAGVLVVVALGVTGAVAGPSAEHCNDDKLPNSPSLPQLAASIQEEEGESAEAEAETEESVAK